MQATDATSGPVGISGPSVQLLRPPLYFDAEQRSDTRPGQARPGQARPGQARPGQAKPGRLSEHAAHQGNCMAVPHILDFRRIRTEMAAVQSREIKFGPIF